MRRAEFQIDWSASGPREAEAERLGEEHVAALDAVSGSTHGGIRRLDWS
jgi:hypothetical protein